MKLTIAVADGKLKPTDQQRAAIGKMLERFNGKAVSVEFKKPASTRSLKQNAYYWHLLTIIGESTGNDTEALHSVFKSMLLPRRFVVFAGKELEAPKTTTELSTKEFGEYVEKVRAYCAQELGMILPDPE